LELEYLSAEVYLSVEVCRSGQAWMWAVPLYSLETAWMLLELQPLPQGLS
jgi:hypothetical protein